MNSRKVLLEVLTKNCQPIGRLLVGSRPDSTHPSIPQILRDNRSMVIAALCYETSAEGAVEAAVAFRARNDVGVVGIKNFRFRDIVYSFDDPHTLVALGELDGLATERSFFCVLTYQATYDKSRGWLYGGVIEIYRRTS